MPDGGLISAVLGWIDVGINDIVGLLVALLAIGFKFMLFMVMDIKPMLSFWMEGFVVSNTGANGSFCTEKSNRLDVAGVEIGAMGWPKVDGVVVLYADARPKGSVEAAAAAAAAACLLLTVERPPPSRSTVEAAV